MDQEGSVCAPAPFKVRKLHTYPQLLYEHQLTAGSTYSLLLGELPDFSFRDEVVTIEFVTSFHIAREPIGTSVDALISPHEEPRRKSSLTTR